MAREPTRDWRRRFRNARQLEESQKHTTMLHVPTQALFLSNDLYVEPEQTDSRASSLFRREVL